MNPEIKGDAISGYSLQGVLTYDTVPKLFRTNSLDYETTTQLDVGGIERIDSAGLALLVEWSSVARSQKKELVLKNIPISLQSLIKVSGLREVLSISDH